MVILVVQTVVLARLNLFGRTPDLVLVSVVIFTVLNEGWGTTLFAGGAGFLQDLLCWGSYFNTISKVVVCSLVRYAQDRFIGNEQSLAWGAVAVLTPAALISEALVMRFYLDRPILFWPALAAIVLTTIYNLLFVPVLFFIIKALGHD